MRIFWKKVTSDLRLHPARSALLAVALVLGSASLAAGLFAQAVMDREIRASFARALPPDVVIVLERVSPDTIRAVAEDPAVLAAEPRRKLRGRIEAADGTFVSLLVTVMPSLTDQEVSAIRLEENVAETKGDGVLIERSSVAVLGFSPGSMLTMRLPGGIETAARFAGIAADGAVAPGIQDRIVYAYATPGQAAALGVGDAYSELHVRLADNVPLGAAIESLTDRLAAQGIVPQRLERSAVRHPHADQMQTALMLLSVFAVAGLVIAASLTANVVAASLRAGQRATGIMKAIGAGTLRLVGVTVTEIGLVALPSVALGLLLGCFAAHGFVRFAAGELNLVGVSYKVSAGTVAAAAVIGLGLPLLTAAIIAWRAVRKPVLDALSPDRLSREKEGFSTRLPMRSVGFAYATGNLGRHPARLFLLMAALSLGGVALLSAANVYVSLVAAVDRVFTTRSDNLDVRLLAPVPEDELRALIETVEGVERAEIWGGLLVAAADEDGPQSGTRFGLLAPPVDTALLRLPVADGRWLASAEALELVASRNLVAKEPRIALGGDVVLEWQGNRVRASVVGIAEEATEPGVYATKAVYDSLVGAPGTGGALRIVTSGEPGAVAARMDEALFRAGAVPALVFDQEELRTATTGHFAILLVLLGLVSITALLIAGLGLASSVAIALVERAREVGVIRALGAPNGTVRKLFLMESLGVTTAAIIAAILLALPVSGAISAMVGGHGLHIDVPLVIAPAGLAVWIAAAVVIAVAATLVPVQKQLRAPAREALAYE